MKFIGIDVHLNPLTIECIDSELNIRNLEDLDIHKTNYCG